MSRNELYHWGILKMKHGERRYQNKDGTWTEEGKARRRAAYEKIRPDTLTDEELKKATDRLKMEKEYTRLVSELYPAKKSRFAKAVADIVEDSAKTLAKNIVSNMFKSNNNNDGGNKNTKTIFSIDDNTLKGLKQLMNTPASEASSKPESKKNNNTKNNTKNDADNQDRVERIVEQYEDDSYEEQIVRRRKIDWPNPR